jgi:DNA repair exonuclease SbcCD ATPase subunit
VFLTNKQELAAVEQQRYEYWVKGFRDLRLWLMDSALSELEMRINSGLIALGLERWGINLAIERENKSGGITRGFTTQVHSPESAGDTPWRSWGGGVTQRLKIAGEIGVSKLIQDRKGIDCGIEVWDEPTAHLSDHGVQDLLIHLQERSREEKKQIWVTDHRVFDFAFDGGLLVEKSSSGSSIKVL